ncbi:MAG: hypothetical protein JKX85_14095, partial [Phycisphaeraceae bacterium]|nr:hypothetical protein [Phycisphaeraceae bacterium]
MSARGRAKGKKGTAGYQIFSLEEHARSKGMWAGLLAKAQIPGLRGVYMRGTEAEPRPVLEPIPNEHVPAVLKVIDEGLVNASDHAKEHAGARKKDRVTEVSLDYDRATGRATIRNDGPGIPIVEHAGATEALGRATYVPEVAFAVFLAGRNMEKPPDCIKGGVNGIGAKLMNVHSTEFELETCCGGQLYTQRFEDRMRVRHEPAIERTKRKDFTRVSFVPAYRTFGYDYPAGELTETDGAEIEAWCHW